MIGIYAQRKSGSGISLHGSNIEPFMSALGHNRTFCDTTAMSAIPPKADIPRRNLNVCFGPKAEVESIHSISLSTRATRVAGTSIPIVLRVD